MKLTRILTIGAMAAAAYAQTSGGITIGGSIPGAISITNDSNAQLSATQTLQSMLPSNSSTLALLDSAVNVRLRSNQQFHLNATATFSNTGAGGELARFIEFAVIGQIEFRNNANDFAAVEYNRAVEQLAPSAKGRADHQYWKKRSGYLPHLLDRAF